MQAICDYMGKSKATILRLIREKGFPAVKIGEEWCSDRELVIQWRRELIEKNKNM
jgi:excisionase family DNA binding protein